MPGVFIYTCFAPKILIRNIFDIQICIQLIEIRQNLSIKYEYIEFKIRLLYNQRGILFVVTVSKYMRFQSLDGTSSTV